MIRISSGEFRGRMLKTPADTKTRPTSARLREAWFNSLQQHIGGTRVLDLFSGSGALGFEALSRGAAHITFVESVRSVCRIIESNAKTLGVEARTQIINQEVDRYLGRFKPDSAHLSSASMVGSFDLILADPPYPLDWETQGVKNELWGHILSPGGFLCIEWGLDKKGKTLPDETRFLVKTREKNYGDSVLTTYRRKDSEAIEPIQPPQPTEAPE